MKKIIFVLSFLLVISENTRACDACGCSVGANYFGILPQFNKNFVGVRYSQSRFNAHMHHEGSTLPDEYSTDTFIRAELWGRFYLSPKIQLFAFVPYHYNTMEGNEQNAVVSGLGDITASAQFLLLNTGEDLQARFRHTLRAGAGVKLPTGKFDEEDGGILLTPNFQRGTGSVDFIVNGLYTARLDKVGMNTEVGYKINTRNKEDYRFGNQFNSGVSFFYWQNFKKAKVSLLPNAGVYVEQAAKHQDGETEKPNTGGHATFFSYGIETYIGPLALGINVKTPLHQELNTETGVDLQAGDRLNMHVTLNF